MSANPAWTDARLATQSPAARAFSLPSPALEIGVAAAGTRGAVRRRSAAIPSWVVFTMIMLATFAVCVTVTMRTQAAMGSAESKYNQMNADVEKIRETNASLRQQVERLHKDPRAIEAAARVNLNMVHANEVVVPLE
jgi:cell division protein FtsB